jgi:hypothetical protein
VKIIGCGPLARLVEDLVLLALPLVGMPQRQRAYEVVTTGSLRLTELTLGLEFLSQAMTLCLFGFF